MFNIVLVIQGNHVVEAFNRVYSKIDSSVTDNINFKIYEINDIDQNPDILSRCAYDLSESDFIYVDLHGGLAHFKSFLKISGEFEGRTKFYFYSGIDSEIDEMAKKCGLTPLQRNTIFSYDNAGGDNNINSLMLYLANQFGNIECGYEAVKIPKWDGVYDPAYGDEIDEDEYIKEVIKAAPPVVGILIHHNYIQYNNLRHIDTLIESVRKYGCIPMPVYTNMMPTSDGSYAGLKGAIKKYFMPEGRAIIDSLIVTVGHSLSILSSPGDGRTRMDKSVFEPLGVPVFHALTTQHTYAEWQAALAGIDSVYLAINVYQTEFDGQLIGVPIAYTEKIETEYGYKSVYFPINERVDKLVRMAKNWSLLRYIPANEKKVAIILHNMPPRIDMIGAAFGLDTPASVYNMCKSLTEGGIYMDYEFESGKDIIDKIIAGFTNDGRYLSPEQMLSRADAWAESDVYSEWFSRLSDKVKGELLRDWGEVPGKFMTVDDKILVPGIINGNLFIGLQPPRAFEEQAEKAYHSTDLVCPYQYLAYYRYLEHVFGANIIVHVGTHGTIEWLPGKEIALSSDCYPDIAIGDLPNIYPYIIDVPGEGAQAKRRIAAGLIDHLIPSMKQSGTYGSIAEIDDLTEQYYRSLRDETNKAKEISELVWKAACENNLNMDLDMSEEDFFADVESSLGRLHTWINEIKTSEVKDGLHIYGVAPQDEMGDRMMNMLRLLVRVRNGDIPSIREAVCKKNGLDLDELLDFPAKINSDGKTNAMILNEIDIVCDEIFRSVKENGYDYDKIAPQLTDQSIKRCVEFACREVYPRLLSTTDELYSFMRGIRGEFISPGPSGAPSRGNAMILPTGRNFYTIDPATVPNRIAWKTGIALANQILDRHLKENGEYPENIAIVVYSGETIKTNGDDLAEILYLYGIRPVYLGATDRVIGLEPIPLDELSRPRIDVTLRISGLFRDTFPNLIELIDDAVNMAASLDEPHEKNFLRKHVAEDVEKFTREGLSADLAEQRAKLRIFGCPPGTYGAGVDILINSKNWQTSDDLGQAYITWSGHAYSKNLHGDKLQNVFSHRLSKCDITIKNISSVETDMLDSDDFYNYHGGLISAVKKEKGSLPASYSTNSADTGHVTTKNIHEDVSRIMRARINNPKWIEGLKKHGFGGAQEFAGMVDIVFGWDATSDTIDDWMYDSIYEKYIGDSELRDWIKEVNPWALHAMSERLMEAAQREMWDASDDKLDNLKDIYLEMESSFEGLS